MIDKLKTALAVIFGGSAAIILFFLQLGLSIMGLIIHIWTIIIAYNWSGALAAIITAFLPILKYIGFLNYGKRRELSLHHLLLDV